MGLLAYLRGREGRRLTPAKAAMTAAAALAVLAVLYCLVFRICAGHVRTDTLSCWHAASDLNPDRLAARWEHVKELERAGRLSQAIDELMIISNESSNSARALMSMAADLDALSQPDAGARVYRAAVRADPAWARCAIDVLLRQSRKGTFETKAAAFERFLMVDPGNVQLRMELASLFASEGLMQDAVDHYAYVMKIDPHNTDACFNAAVLLGLLGKTDESIEYYERAVRLNPSDVGARTRLQEAIQARDAARSGSRSQVR